MTYLERTSSGMHQMLKLSLICYLLRLHVLLLLFSQLNLYEKFKVLRVARSMQVCAQNKVILME